MKSKKVILDTNLWISYLITSKFDKLDNLIETSKIKLLFSHELIEEFLSVAKRPKFLNTFLMMILEIYFDYLKNMVN